MFFGGNIWFFIGGNFFDCWVVVLFFEGLWFAYRVVDLFVWDINFFEGKCVNFFGVLRGVVNVGTRGASSRAYRFGLPFGVHMAVVTCVLWCSGFLFC